MVTEHIQVNMAYFAELDANEKVLRVVSVDNSNVSANMAIDGETYCENNIAEDPNIPYVGGVYPGVAWKQTSINHSFRKRFAAVDGYFVDDSGDGYFTAPKPYSDWVLNVTDGAYYPPIEKPSVDTYTEDSKTYQYVIAWDQDNTRYTATKVAPIKDTDRDTFTRWNVDGETITEEEVDTPASSLTDVVVWDPSSASWS